MSTQTSTDNTLEHDKNATLENRYNFFNRLKLRNKIIVALSLPLFIVLPITAIIYTSTAALIDSDKWIAHTHKVIAHARLLEKQILELETGERGFLITGKEVFLEPFYSAENSWNENIELITNLVDDNPPQVKLIRKVDLLKKQWIRLAAAPEIELRRQVNVSQASMSDVISLVEKEIGKNIIDKIRMQLTAFIDHEKELITIREDKAKAIAKQTTNQIIITACIIVLISYISAFILIRTILSPISVLLRATKLVSQGKMNTEVSIQGDDEISELANSFNTMIISLQISSEKLEAKAHELIKSNRSKSEFLANMSHEIRTPMNGILGMAQLLLRSKLDDDQREKINRLIRSGESLLIILSEILDYSKIEANKIVIEQIDVDLPEILEDVASFFSSVAAEKGLKFIYNLDDLSDPIVIGDPTRIRQVINNLCSNAVKFTQEGSVCVVVKSHSVDKRSHITIEVIDTGIGIEEKSLSTIFQEFSQAEGSTNREYGGTGLGLSISKNLVELMGGELSVTSVPTKGTTFSIAIDLAISDTDLSQNKETIIDHTSIKTLKTLVVDDNETNVVLLSWMLEEWGHEVLSAVNGEECIETLNTNDIDVIFMDYHMPVLDGKAATIKIRAQDDAKKDTIIIGCTADAFSESTQLLLDSGQNMVISKPVIEKDLHNALAKYFAKH